jgi:hypothetical protein
MRSYPGLRNGIDSQGRSSEEMRWSQAAALCLKSMEQVSMIGVDIAKRVFQVLPFLASQPPWRHAVARIIGAGRSPNSAMRCG